MGVKIDAKESFSAHKLSFAGWPRRSSVLTLAVSIWEVREPATAGGYCSGQRFVSLLGDAKGTKRQMSGRPITALPPGPKVRFTNFRVRLTHSNPDRIGTTRSHMIAPFCYSLIDYLSS